MGPASLVRHGLLDYTSSIIYMAYFDSSSIYMADIDADRNMRDVDIKPYLSKQKAIFLHHTKRTHQLSFYYTNTYVDHHTGGKGFIHGPKRHKGKQL